MSDDALKAQVPGGGPRAQVQARFEATWRRVQAAAETPLTWTSLLETCELPPGGPRPSSGPAPGPRPRPAAASPRRARR
ncbi:MAG: hypothetical protein INH41_29970 [Myxococcaceae bacterium]|nr:hypothetical protein [Myxococcaceae bacterium]